MKYLKRVFVTITAIAMIETLALPNKVNAEDDSFKLNEYKNIEDTYIINIHPNTIYTDFIKNVESNNEIAVKSGESIITEEDLIKTGQTLTIGDKSYTLVVTGDVNGDGKADIQDILKINKHRLNKVKLNNAYLLAGQVNYDDSVDINDLLQINKFRLKKIKYIKKLIVEKPLNLQVNEEGIVTWNEAENATGYEISIDNQNWEEASSGINYLSKITEQEGERTIYVRAINTDDEKFMTPSEVATLLVTVNKTTEQEPNPNPDPEPEPEPVDDPQETTSMLKENISASATSEFLGTTITRDKIAKISFANSIDGHTVDGTTCFDVSEDNSKKVLLWIEKQDEEENYEIVIGQNGGVKANPKSEYLFSYIGCSIPAEINLTNFDTTNVQNMNSMFYKCEEVQNLDLGGFDTSNVTDMANMFSECLNLQEINLSSFNTTKVTTMNKMFRKCNSLKELNLNNFDTQSVTNMNSMFYDCHSLTSIDLSSFRTDLVTTMFAMFYNCNKLPNLNINNFNTSMVTDMYIMFRGCEGLTNLDISSFNTEKVTRMRGMFANCINLNKIYVSINFVTASLPSSSAGSGMFTKDEKLVGGEGTTYSETNVDYTYAHIDEGTSNPGYFTRSE